MSQKFKGLTFIFLFACLFLFSCVGTPLKYTARDFVVVETTKDDTLENLAGKYLNDPKKAWMISEFNKIKEVRQGQRIVIPLKPFNKGGLSKEGFQVVPIFCFNITDSEKQGNKASAQSRFDALLGHLERNGYHVISLSQFMDFINYTGQIPEKSVVITVDDNSRAVTDWVLPALKAHDFPVTLFVDARETGKEGNVALDQLKPYLSSGLSVGCRAGWALDKEIEQNQLNLKVYFENLEKEIGYSKNAVEKETGMACRYYAYPPTGWNHLLVSQIKKYGFKAGLTLNGQPNPFYVDSFAVERTVVSVSASIEEFEKKLVVFSKMDLN